MTHTVAAGCEHWEGHVIVCGLEGVGLRTVEQLRDAGVRVAVVDDDPDQRRAELVIAWGAAHLPASGSLDDELQAAGIAGARAVVCTHANDLRKLEVLATFYVRNRPFLVARLTVRPDGGLVGLAMRELGARIRVVAIVPGSGDGEMEHPPRRDTRLAAGDQAYLLGPYEELLRVLARERAGLNS